MHSPWPLSSLSRRISIIDSTLKVALMSRPFSSSVVTGEVSVVCWVVVLMTSAVVVVGVTELFRGIASDGDGGQDSEFAFARVITISLAGPASEIIASYHLKLSLGLAASNYVMQILYWVDLQC